MNWRFPDIPDRFRSLAWRSLPGTIAMAMVAGLLRLGAWQSLEQASYNTLFHLRQAIDWDERVVIVAIDEPSLTQLGRLPLPRRYYTELLQSLTQAQASIVVLNVVFAESSQEDDGLADAIAQNGRVVLAQTWDSTLQPLRPPPALEENAIALGHVINHPDTDGVTRYIDPVVRGVPYLGIAALQAYSLVQEPVPLPQNQRLWVNWLGSAQQAPQYSLLEILRGEIPLNNFYHKIVVVGVTAGGVDSVFTPFDRNPPTTGVFLNATVISNLLQQQPLRVVGAGWLVAVLIAGGPGLSFFLVSCAWGRRLIALLVINGCWLVISLLLFQAGYWLSVAVPMILFCLNTAIVEIAERLRISARLQQNIERIWQSHYQDLLVWAEPASPDLLAHPLADPLANPLADPLADSLADPLREPEIEVFSGSLPPVQNFQSVAIESIQRLSQLAEQFARSQSAHAAIARSLSIGLLAADWDGLIWFCNPVAVDWLKIRVGDRLRNKLVPSWLTAAQWQEDWQMLHQGQLTSRELQQGDRWLSIKLEPLFYQPALLQNPAAINTTPTGLLLLLEDITPHKQAEAEIRRALAQEKELNELKSRFVSMISHEFRTPLTIIQSTTELLEYYESSAERKRDRFQRIHGAVQHMTQLLEDVLLMGKAEAEKLELRPEPLHLPEFCQTLLTDLQITAHQHQLCFTSWGEPRPVWLDAKLFRQILTNLLSNAIKYSPQGGSVELALGYQADQVILSVRDHGIGIPLQDQERLFETFHRAANVNTIQGTGLGLAIVKHCVDLHEGNIEVQSQVGIGTTFTVTLPCNREQTDRQKAKDKRQ
jgi:signal transduction histidine kinase